MPRLNLDLNAISASRVAATEVRRDVQTSARQIADQKETIALARRNGASDQSLLQLNAQLAQLADQHRSLAVRQNDLLKQIGNLVAGLVGRNNPANLVQALDGTIPVALFPVRLETRYVGNPVQLAIRVYPDTLNVVRHSPGLTAAERERGEAYWTAKFERNPDDGAEAANNAEARAAAIWREMAAVYRAPRAAWIVRILTPSNLAAIGQPELAPDFPDDIDDVTSIARQPFAAALPDRWCAVGIKSGKEVFRVWGKNIPDVLPMGPSLDPSVPPADASDAALFGGDRKWLVDFDTAVNAGMGITVRAQDLVPNYQFAAGLDRLVVLGVDWTLDAKASAAAVSALFQSHQAASDFAFVPLGTPTNNTGDAVSGFASGQAGQGPPVIQHQETPGEFSAVDLMRMALSLNDALDPANVLHSDLVEQATSMHMINALWRGTLGRYLSLMLNPGYPGADPDAEKSATDSYVPKAVVAQLREFAMRYLRPAGPFAAFRIEKQPYGLLPIVSKNYIPAPGNKMENGVRKVLGALRPRWTLSAQRVPHLIDGNLQKVTDLLQTGPWSRLLKYRGVDDPMASYYAPIIEGGPDDTSIGNQQTIKAGLTNEFLGLFGVVKAGPRDCMIDNLTMPSDGTPMIGVPWVQADPHDPKKEIAPDQKLLPDAQGKNYIETICDALSLPSQQAKNKLNSLQSGTSLLEAMLAFSAEEEFDHGGVSILEQVDRADNTRPWNRTVVSQATPQFVNIEAPIETESWVEVQTTRQLASLRVPSITGGATIEDHLARAVRVVPSGMAQVSAAEAANHLIDSVVAFPAYVQDLGKLKKSLSYLAGRTAGELDIALKTTLDAYSHRLDAWYTALASSRLAAVRAARPDGLYLGGYGWVENLPGPTRQPDSLGFVHAPSLPQAAAAAILRSGHLANNESAKSTFNMDLSSQRARRALNILEGVGRGQSLAALLGYRFERAMRDGLLGQYTLPLRKAFPLRPTDDNPADGPQEQIAVRDVVDGIKLLEKFQGGASGLFSAVIAANPPAPLPAPQTPMTIPPADRNAITALLQDLAETWDAVSDVLVAEGVYQVAQGNLERAGGALAVLDKQDRPIQPQVTQTPRKGVSYAQRLFVVCETANVAESWSAATAGDPHASSEPRLNSWLAKMLGAPARFAFEAQILQNDVAIGNPLSIAPNELGWSPLSIVLASRAISGTGQAAHSALRARIAQSLAAQVPNPDAGTSLLIAPSASQPGMLGLDAFEALATTLARLVERARPLTRKDMVVPRDDIEAGAPDEGEYPGVDLAEIETRAAAAVTLLENYINDLNNAPDQATILRQLMNGWIFGMGEAMPGAAPSAQGEFVANDEDDGQLQTRRARAAAQAQSQLDAADALAPDAPAQAGIGHGTRVQNAIDRIKAVFGRGFPVLPQFTLGGYSAEVQANLDSRNALTASNLFAICGWLPKLARVREGADRLNAAVTVHESLVAIEDLAEFKIAQFPFRSHALWAALTQAWNNPDNDPDLPRRQAPQMAWVAHAPDALGEAAADTPLAGLLIDEWQEFVPSTWQTTAISFHYDAPGSRPPQTMLLALPPQLNLENWTFDELLANVQEAFDLAQLRAVRPQDMVDGLGLMLPANYLPENPEKDVPSVRVAEMVTAALSKYAGALALGKV